MRKLSVLVAMMLFVAACGGSAEEATDTTTASEPTSSVAAETTTTVAETTTTAAETTTSVAEESTTTAGGTAGVAKGLDTLLASVESESTQEIVSARIEGSMSVVGAEAEGAGTISFDIPFTTTFDLDADAFAMTMDMSGMAETAESDGDPLAAMMLTEFEVRQIGEDAFIKMPFLSAMLGSDAEWIKMPADESEGFTADMGVQTDPYEMLNEYRDANADVEEIGTESVNGVDATHYRIVIDGETYAASLSDEERAELESAGPLPTGEFPMDIWISEDGYVVRMVMEIDGSQAEFEEGESFESMTLTYDVFDINQPVEIAAPTDFVDGSELTGAFGDLEG